VSETTPGRGRLDGKAILLVGGAQGIGRGCVLAIASEGANVVIADLNGGGAEDAAKEASERGPRCLGFKANVVDQARMEELVALTVAEFGRLDGVVNLAYAGSYNGPVADMPVEALERELHVDVVGSFIVLQAALPELRKTRGSVVNFSSGAGVEGTIYMAGYAAAKAAIRALTRSAAMELGAEGIRLNSVCPYADSPNFAKVREDAGPEKADYWIARSPLRRIGDPELDVGAAVAFLLSEDARYITGQTIMLDGGNTHL
jgi:NAD(P)-dependent dehydrogenase (short-subunit alcohol dehydrogenase family)